MEDDWKYTPLATKPLLNRTDPIVRHDPSIQKHPVAKMNIDSKPNPSGIHPKNAVDMKRIEGTQIPIIRISNLVVDFRNIQYMYIDYDSFVPTIVLKLSQLNKSMEIAEVPGMGADMTVVLTAQVDGAYKPISIEFYIRDINYTSSDVTYYGVYKLMKMDEPMTKQIQFNEPPVGCSAEHCQLGPNPHPTTYEFLHYAAVTDLGLGFAATKEVKEIKDDKFRFLHNESYYDAIQKHVAFGGLDSSSIFDCWIDLYRYLVVVNVPWIMKEDVKPEELGIHAITGVDAGSNLLDEDKETGMVHRLITNNKKMPAYSNMTFNNYEFVVDNTAIQDEGTVTSCIVSNPVSNNGNDSCEQTDLKISEQSVDGYKKSSEYLYRKQKYLGPEFGNDENTPILLQKNIHDSYFRKLRSRRLKVEMDSPNLGLQRGTLVNVLIYEYYLENKKYLFANTYKNLPGNSPDTEEGETLSNEDIQLLHDDSMGVLNAAISGMYYIDGMTFEYDNVNQKFIQRLYLIKKGFIGNIANIGAYPKVAI